MFVFHVLISLLTLAKSHTHLRGEFPHLRTRDKKNFLLLPLGSKSEEFQALITKESAVARQHHKVKALVDQAHRALALHCQNNLSPKPQLFLKA